MVPHVDKAPLPLRILRLVTSNFLPVENPTHPTAHAPERASVYILGRLVPHVDKAPLPLRILRLVTSNFLPVENPTHPTAHAPERASVYILGQFRTSK